MTKVIPARPGPGPANDNDFQDALLRIIDNRLADIVSNSWVSTEDQAVTNMAAYDQIFEQAASEGIGVYFSSGDAGYSGPNTAEGAVRALAGLQVNYPLSSPWVTAVGDGGGAVRWPGLRPGLVLSRCEAHEDAGCDDHDAE